MVLQKAGHALNQHSTYGAMPLIARIHRSRNKKAWVLGPLMPLNQQKKNGITK